MSVTAPAKLSETLREALAERSRYLREGFTPDQADKGIEAMLRDAFPRTKFEPSCPVCDDTGWEVKHCTYQDRCGRQRCSDHPEHEHEYVRHCTCEKGQRFTRQQEQRPDGDAAINRAMSKSGGWTRAGR